MIHRIKHRCILLLSALLVAALAMGQNQPLPKPQIPSAEGKQAPDFSLPDQDGRNLRLSSLRGYRVVLIFYRGYW